MTETIQQLKEDIAVLQEKLQKLEEIEKQPRMNLQQEGEYAVVSYHDKVYYRLEGEVTFSWYIKKGVSVGYPVPTLMIVNDAETERLLEGLYYNYIQVKKEKEQRTKSPVEECYKDWWGQYPETGTWDNFDDKRWQGFQAGYEFAYAISTAKEVMEKVQEEQKWDAVRESVKWCEEHPDESVEEYLKPQTPEQIEKSLRKAFKKVQQTEEWKETQRKIDAPKESWMNKPVEEPKPMDDAINRLLEKYKSQKLWNMVRNELGYSIDCCDEIVDLVEKWLPKEQSAEGSQNAFAIDATEGFNHCLNKIKGTLR